MADQERAGDLLGRQHFDPVRVAHRDSLFRPRAHQLQITLPSDNNEHVGEWRPQATG